MLTVEERELRLGELLQFQVRLDADPVSNGLVSLNAKIAQIQGFKDRANALLLEAIKNKQDAELVSNERNFEYENRIEKLLATDPEIQNQKSEKSRVAVANTKCSELVLQKHYAEQELSSAESYYRQVQHTYEYLESVNSALSRQISVIQMGIQIGEISRSDLGSLFGKNLTLTK